MMKIVDQIVVHVSDGSNVLTLGIAVVGGLLGALSFGWQLLSRRLEQPRLRVKLRRAWADPAHTQVVTGPPNRAISPCIARDSPSITSLLRFKTSAGSSKCSVRSSDHRQRFRDHFSGEFPEPSGRPQD
jgi:hypothetical protein